MANTGQYDSQTNIETEDYEREIFVRPEAAVIYGGSVVNSVNGQVGDVILTTSDLENTSDYQTGAQVQNAIAGKQDKLTAGSGLNLDGTILSVDTNIIATVQDVTDEATIRENSDANLQGQIDALTVSSDVIDVLGTYQDLQNYDTTHVKENDIIKVLQDSTHNNAMSYYRWVVADHVGSWVYVGSEGPYYTKSEADALLNAKQNTLTAGSNVQIVNDTISATDTTYTAGTGLALNGTQFSVDTTAIATQSDLTAGLATKQDTLTAGANVQINNNTISATDTTYSDFTGTDGTAAGAAGLVPAPATTDAGKFLKADGTWDTAGGGGPTVVQTPGTSTTDVMSQNAVTSMVFADPATQYRIKIGTNAANNGVNTVVIGSGAQAGANRAIAIGASCYAVPLSSVAIGFGALSTAQGQFDIGEHSGASSGYNSSVYRLLTGLYDPQSAHDAATKGYVDNSLLGKADKISVVQTSASTIEINPNTFYKFGEVASLNITLASITDNTIYNEYMFEFVSGTTATTLTLPSSIKWLETPTIDANKIYQCSIVDNVGLLVGVANV